MRGFDRHGMKSAGIGRWEVENRAIFNSTTIIGKGPYLKEVPKQKHSVGTCDPEFFVMSLFKWRRLDASAKAPTRSPQIVSLDYAFFFFAFFDARRRRGY